MCPLNVPVERLEMQRCVYDEKSKNEISQLFTTVSFGRILRISILIWIFVRFSAFLKRPIRVRDHLVEFNTSAGIGFNNAACDVTQFAPGVTLQTRTLN